MVWKIGDRCAIQGEEEESVSQLNECIARMLMSNYLEVFFSVSFCFFSEAERVVMLFKRKIQ